MTSRRGKLTGRAAVAVLAVWLATAAGVIGTAGSSRAQDLGVPAAGNVLVIDTNQLFAESAFGHRVKADIEARGRALAAENRRIEAELAAEEKALTEERPAMAPEAFRDKADAFDAKVKQTREEQEAKALELAEAGDAAQRRFLAVAQPVLETLMAERGAVVMLERRAVLLHAGAVDVTKAATRRIDAAIGDGSAILTPPESPAPAPAPDPGQPDQD